MNCYGSAAEPVPLPGGDGNGITAENIEDCRDFCYATDGCQGIVYGQGMCYGKKDVKTSKCQPGGGYVTELLTQMPFGTCNVMGDPHILTFDNPLGQLSDITQTVAGDYSLISSHELQVHGRFGYSSRFPAEASLTGLAMAGSLIQENTLVIEYVGGALGYPGFKVWWSGQPILGGFPATFESADGILRARLDNIDPDDISSHARHTIGGEPGSGSVPSFLFEVAPDIRIYCLIGQETMNTVITLRKLRSPMDGYCGNFDCKMEDDSLQALSDRKLENPIPAEKSLFKNSPAPPAEQLKKQGNVKSQNDCDPDLLQKAQKEVCANMPAGMKDACVFDVCASGDVKAGQEDALAETLAVEVGAKYSLFGLQFPNTFATSISWAASLFFVGAILTGMVGYGGRFSVFESNRESNRRQQSRPFLGTENDDALTDDEEAHLLGPIADEMNLSLERRPQYLKDWNWSWEALTNSELSPCLTPVGPNRR
eukprot:CAMPEP_0206605272 /NCGR_PEP_ID=MMETSP0325_2-20121206/50289_1 /ASSEMBLY_ACC=CAM_ASM_000347 /TAXON_ID=2866 /ORGANISM="Crypthecodinium cohnii, Strain Seligo" /LENGTH=482 /DNA_ID=CAMNT_0054120729 /DNA_START=332 /DNA_END=1778 /DNA_ORIENTATION=+